MRITRHTLYLLMVSLSLLSMESLPPLSRVQAATVGLVCIADPSSTSCPSSPLAISGNNGTQLQIAVNIEGSDSMNGFDLLVKADPLVLRGVSVDLNSSILGSNILTLAECVDLTGFGCLAGQNGLGSARVAAVALGFVTPAPTTGRLFTIAYDILKSSSDILVDFQTGCKETSVSPDICVTIVNGATVVQETSQGSSGSPGDFSVALAFCCSTIRKGSSAWGLTGFTSLSGFFGGISITISVSPQRRNGPVAFFSTTASVFLQPGTSATLFVGVTTFRTTPVGTYTLTVTGTSGSISYSAIATFKVVPR